VSTLLPRPATRAINHVLRATPLALERVRRHAGRTVAFHVGPAIFAFTAQTTGEVEPAVGGAAHDVEVRLSPFLLARIAAGDQGAFDAVAIEGDADLAGDVDFLMRNLSWDAEEDLARVVGDIAAHRIAEGARTLRAWTGEAALRLGQGAAEYWTEESPMIASRVKLEGFAREVAELDAAIGRLEARIAKLG
jgi:ubiquinone biosynthesis protein UbiJ